MGADRIITIGFEPLAAAPAPPPPRARTPRLTDVAVNVLDGLHHRPGRRRHASPGRDQLVLRRRARRLRLVVGARLPRVRAAARPYRRIRYALVAPSERGELGRLAEEAYLERYGGLRALRDPDAIVLGRLLRAGGGGRGELLSYLLFDQAFVRRLVEAGRHDAGRWLDRHPEFWCADSAHDFDLDPTPAIRAAELARLDEWRALRR